MNPAEKLAYLKAIYAGLGGAIKVAEDDVRMLRELTGARTFDTQIGTVSWTTRKPTLGFDEDALLGWAKEHMPHEVETIVRVRETLKKTLADRFHIDGDTVVDSHTGEVIDWAYVKPGSEGTSVRLTDEAKTSAQSAVLANLDSLAGSLEVTS